jgi:hypothetical protein
MVRALNEYENLDEISETVVTASRAQIRVRTSAGSPAPIANVRSHRTQGAESVRSTSTRRPTPTSSPSPRQ